MKWPGQGYTVESCLTDIYFMEIQLYPDQEFLRSLILKQAVEAGEPQRTGVWPHMGMVFQVCQIALFRGKRIRMINPRRKKMVDDSAQNPLIASSPSE